MTDVSRTFKNLFSFPNLLLLILWCSPLLFGGALDKNFLHDPDIWWHLRNAEVLTSSHHFIQSDNFSFTVRGLPWINPEWMAELPFYLGYRAFGLQGLYYISLAAFELIIAGVFRLAFLRSRDFMAAYVATLAFVLLAWINFGPRTILFGWICLIAEMLILEASRRREAILWWLVPLFAFWINLHGSWIIGVVFFLLYAVSGLAGGTWGDITSTRWTPSQLRRRLAVGAACAVSLFLNPYGARLVFYPFDFAFQQQLNVSRGLDWVSVDFHTMNGKVFLLVLAGLAVLTLLRHKSRRLDEVLFALIAVYSAVTYVRFLFLAGIILAPALALDIAAEEENLQAASNRPWLNAAIMAAVLAVAAFRFPRQALLRQGVEQAFPAAAFARLETFNPQDHVFNAYAYGGYMIWRSRSIPTFIDSRTDIFEHHGILADYTNAIDIRDTLAILDHYKIHYIFFPKSDPVIYLLQNIPGWKVNFDDGQVEIMERTKP